MQPVAVKKTISNAKEHQTYEKLLSIQDYWKIERGIEMEKKVAPLILKKTTVLKEILTEDVLTVGLRENEFENQDELVQNSVLAILVQDFPVAWEDMHCLADE